MEKNIERDFVKKNDIIQYLINYDNIYEDLNYIENILKKLKPIYVELSSEDIKNIDGFILDADDDDTEYEKIEDIKNYH